MPDTSPAAPAPVFRPVSAFDVPRRDPTSWTLSAVLDDGSKIVLDHQSAVDAPAARSELYPPFYLVAPPPQFLDVSAI